MRFSFPIYYGLILSLCNILPISSVQAEETKPATPQEEKSEKPHFRWLIYWYLCGSDLESQGAAATNDLGELLKAKLPDDVAVIIQAGGSKEWQNEGISADDSTRLLFHKGEIEVLEKNPKVNMGKSSTLSDFLKFGEKRFDADQKMLIIWNHGGGSVTGVAFDEQFEGDGLDLAELKQALNSAFGEPKEDEKAPLDIIGFDACLMATIETATTLQEYAHYMIASQELESSIGWSYDQFLTELGKDSKMPAEKLAKTICSTYLSACQKEEQTDKLTLSVIDLDKIDKVDFLLEVYGASLLTKTAANSNDFANFTRKANKVPNYGPNSKQAGYTNMVDLGALIKSRENEFPKESKRLLSAIDDCIIYKVNGAYNKSSSGLSCYCPLNADKKEFSHLVETCPSTFLAYHGARLGFIPSEKVLEIAKEVEALAKKEVKIDEPIEMPQLPESIKKCDSEIEKLKDFKITLTEKGEAQLTLGPDRSKWLSSIRFQFVLIDVKEDVGVVFGSDANLKANWETGIFKDNFSGTWPAIDGHFVYLEITGEEENYNSYSIPIKLNGKRSTLEVIYDFKKKAYIINGARRHLEENGIPDKNIQKLKKGDKITTIFYGFSLSDDENKEGEDDIEEIEVDTFELTDKIVFEDTKIGNGTFGFMFEMEDFQQKSELSEMVFMNIDGENITVSKELPSNEKEQEKGKEDDNEEEE